MSNYNKLELIIGILVAVGFTFGVNFMAKEFGLSLKWFDKGFIGVNTILVIFWGMIIFGVVKFVKANK